MKFKAIFLILAVSALASIMSAEPAFSQDKTCKPHTICVNSGDILKYDITFRDINSSQTYSFGDMVDANNIKVLQSQEDGNKVQNTTLVLNLETGFAHNSQDVSAVRPFLEILASPVDYNKSDTSITPLVTEFNGFKRTTLTAFHSNENSTSKIIYDIQTGVLLEEHASSIITIRGNPVLVDFSDKLTSTNMINSDSDGIKPNNVSIPKWIKNTAKMWSQGDLNDSEFTNAIQYLISNGVMHIPHGVSGASSTQTIPTWIKHSTGMWAGGQITDDEFVQSIQWLITKGIIQVEN